MYIIDFAKNLFSKSNIGVLIWLILNSVLVTVVLGYTIMAEGSIPELACFLIGFGVYFVSIVIALSPVGEAILRFQQGCKKIKDPEIINRLEPLFMNVYGRAQNLTPNLNKKINFYISNDKNPNAFATGRSTVCVTRGLLNFSDAEIEGVLAHEFGHLAHKDTDAILIVAVGNLIVSVIFTIYRLIMTVFAIMTSIAVGLVSRNFGLLIKTLILRVFIDGVLYVVMLLWTKLGVLICLASSRKNEYKADEYAFNLGYGRELSSVLSKLGGSSKDGLWAALNSSHPKTEDRIRRLNQLF